jgi:hypothetical protein
MIDLGRSHHHPGATPLLSPIWCGYFNTQTPRWCYTVGPSREPWWPDVPGPNGVMIVARSFGMPPALVIKSGNAAALHLEHGCCQMCRSDLGPWNLVPCASHSCKAVGWQAAASPEEENASSSKDRSIPKRGGLATFVQPRGRLQSTVFTKY